MRTTFPQFNSKTDKFQSTKKWTKKLSQKNDGSHWIHLTWRLRLNNRGNNMFHRRMWRTFNKLSPDNNWKHSYAFLSWGMLCNIKQDVLFYLILTHKLIQPCEIPRASKWSFCHFIYTSAQFCFFYSNSDNLSFFLFPNCSG